MKTRLPWIWICPLCAVSACRSPAPVPDVPQQSLRTAAAPVVEEQAKAPTFISRMPLISRAKKYVGQSAVKYSDAKMAGDGDTNTAWTAGTPSEQSPAWIAIDLGKGPSKILFAWKAAGSFNYDETDYGSPGAYRLEVSADSTDGEDGTWKTEAQVPQVTSHARAHELDFRGDRWVRMVVTAAPSPSPNGVQIDTIDVFDASRGASDTWFFMGDSITATAFGRRESKDPGFSQRVTSRYPDHNPLVLCGGVGGEKSEDGARHVDAWLAENPDAKFWAIEYGSNDAAGDSTDTRAFKKSLVQILDRVEASGRIPILATIPYSTEPHHTTIPEFNRVIESLRVDRAVLPGPDLYAWFEKHPDELRDGLHPNEKGVTSINRLWAEAVDGLYAASR